MSAAANLMAELVDLLSTAAPTLAIPIDPARVFQMQPDANGQTPYLVVVLPNPFLVSEWSGSGQLVDTHFFAEVQVVTQLPRGVAHILGDNTQPGEMNLVESIIDALENNFSAFKAAAPSLVDYRVKAGGALVDAATGWLIQCPITIDFWTRTTAGNR